MSGWWQRQKTECPLRSSHCACALSVQIIQDSCQREWNHTTINVDGPPGVLGGHGILLEGPDLMQVDLKAFGNSEV